MIYKTYDDLLDEISDEEYERLFFDWVKDKTGIEIDRYFIEALNIDIWDYSYEVAEYRENCSGFDYDAIIDERKLGL